MQHICRIIATPRGRNRVRRSKNLRDAGLEPAAPQEAAQKPTSPRRSHGIAHKGHHALSLSHQGNQAVYATAPDGIGEPRTKSDAPYTSRLFPKGKYRIKQHA